MTPSWLSVDQSKYAIRTITKINYGAIRPKLGVAYCFFFGAILLMAYSLYQFTKPTLPSLVPWLMLFGSVAIFLFAAAVAFRTKTRYKVIVTLLDGEKIPVITPNGEQAKGLLDSLTLAMDWHRNSDVVIDAARSSHVRQAYAASSKGVADSGAGSAKAAGTDPKQHPSKVAGRLPPVIAAMLKGRD